MKNVGVIFGGKSVEHDVSIITGFGVLKNLGDAYNAVPIYIDKDGSCFTGKALCDFTFYQHINIKYLKKCYFQQNDSYLHISCFRKKRIKLDIVVNCLHGVNGEDGAMSGILQLANIPETSCGVLGNAICMDKVITKLLLSANGVHNTKYLYFYANEWSSKNKEIILKIDKEIGLPCVIKPSRGGSSLGVHLVKERKEIEKAIVDTLLYDTKILVEECVKDFREVNISVFDDGATLQFSSVEEILKNDNFFDFNNKYDKNTKIKRICPAELEPNVIDRVLEYGKLAYKICECKGIVRMDYFVTNDDVILNEINTIPGSLSFYLWKNKGYTFGRLLHKLLQTSMVNFKERQKLKNITNTSILANLNNENFNMNK